MKKLTYIVMTLCCLTILTSTTGCSKDGDGKIEFTSERRELSKGQAWTVDGPVDRNPGEQQKK